MSSSLTLFERQPQSIAVCYLYPLSPSQNTPSCYLVSSALTLKALKGKTAEGEKATVVSINHVAVSEVFLFYFFISSTYIISAVVYTRYGHCHHLSVECLALAPTGKSYPPLRQEMQDAFRPEHMRQEAECARVDFPCSSSEQDLKDGKMMTMTFYSPQRGFLHCSTGAASATFISSIQ